jgi:hypothetical protein
MSSDQANYCRAEKALIENYKLFCPNADQYGLSGCRINEFDIDAMNARLKRLPIGLNIFQITSGESG